jgi:mono/diheme cytochrome c family protein
MSVFAKRFLLVGALAGSVTLAAGAASAQDMGGPGGTHSLVPEAVTGEQVFTQVCRACHMANAKGGTGAGTIPALAGNPNLAVAGYPLTVVVYGRGGMPPLGKQLTPSQIANAINYVRTHFGNNYKDAVTEADVKQIEGSK